MKRTAILTALAIMASAAGAGAQQASVYWQFDNCSSPVFTAAGAQQASAYWQFDNCFSPAFTAAGAQQASAAILTRNDASFRYEDMTHALYTRTYSMTVTGKDSDDYLSFSCNVNNGSTKLKSFSGEIKEATGKTRKIKKSDLQYTEYSEGLADSYGAYFYSPTVTSYPATVTYSYEIAYSDAVLSFPPFNPLPYNGNVALVKATYTLEVPSEDCFTYRNLNMPDCKPEKSATSGGVSFRWTTENLASLPMEQNSPSSSSRLRAVLFSPAEFSYEGEKGRGKDWKEIGDWLASLMPGEGSLPEELKARLDEITAGCTTDMEKIGKVYSYLGETTRYVSIQLGLGGLKPLDPAYVFKNKFGDCKALSAYLQAMLAHCGIASDYVIINLGEDRFIPDFPSLATTNHAILCIPQQGDTLWVECTNPEIPLGYVHGQIAGNRALVVKKGGSYVTTLPSHPDESNADSFTADVVLGPDGSAEVSASQDVRESFWERFHALARFPYDKQVDFVKEDFSLPMVDIKDLEIKDFPGEKPRCALSFKASVPAYASKTGNRLFIQVNPFRSYPDNTTRSRKSDLYFREGWRDSDTLTLRIPEGFSVEAAPKDVNFENAFGHVRFAMETAGNTITLRFDVLRRSGLFPKEDYEQYRSLRKNLEKTISAKIVLVKDM